MSNNRIMAVVYARMWIATTRALRVALNAAHFPKRIGERSMQRVDLDVTLIDLAYPVTRKLTVPLSLRLTDLHLVLQAAMGWDNSHLYDYTCGRSLRWADEAGFFEGSDDRSLAKSTLADVIAEMGRQKSFTYTYDMGDSWEHDLRPSKPRDMAAGEAVIALLGAVGRCPPDDSGGARGFGYMLDCLADPDSDERADHVEWLGAEVWDQTVDLADRTKVVAMAAKWMAKRYKG